MGYLMKNAVTRAFQSWHTLIFQGDSVQAVWSMLGLVQHPLPGIWNVSLCTGNRGDMTGRANSAGFISWKWSWGKWCIQIQPSSQHFCFLFPMYTFHLLYYWTIMRKIPDITLGWIVKLLIFDSFLTNKEIHFIWFNLIPLYLGLFQYIVQKIF